MSETDCFNTNQPTELKPFAEIGQWSERDVFYWLTQNTPQTIEIAYSWLTAQINCAKLANGEHFIPWQTQALEQLKITCATPKTGITCAKLIASVLPIIQTELDWLAGVSNTATSDHELPARLLTIYQQITQGTDYRQSAQGLLQAYGQAPYPLSSWAYCNQPEIPASVFALSATQQALTYCPRILFPELLGFTWAFCQTQHLLGLSPTDPLANTLIQLRQTRLASQQTALQTLIQDYCLSDPEQTALLWQRLQSGFWLYQHLLNACQHALIQKQQALTPAHIIAKVLTQKASSAFGHHRRIRLGSRYLDDWFADTPFDSQGFMQALIESDYINPANPKQSRLLNLFSFNGPMFGVLTPQEIQALENWLNNLSPFGETTNPPATLINSQPCPNTLHLPSSAEQKIYRGITHRQLYYYLVNADLYPSIDIIAKQKVQTVLNASKRWQQQPFQHYSHRQFQDYFKALYQREMQAYQPLTGKPKLSKQAYLWGIWQFAPTLLVDGCWLQNQNAIKYAGIPAITERLEKIYHDEIGSGIRAQNHPFIFRQLLESQDIHLPAIHSPNFIAVPQFLDSAFDLPVYLMAIAKAGTDYLPELLGLNLAIEISGLGKVYLRLADELSYWGINPAMVNLHTTIDNTATGHAALASEAIQIYLDNIGVSAGESQKQAQWRRIYNGYCSLAGAVRYFKIALVGRYLLNHYNPFFKPSLHASNPPVQC